MVVALGAGFGLAGVAGASQSAASCSAGVCTATFSADGSQSQSYTVPSGVDAITVAAYGAAGGASVVDLAPGGKGGEVSGVLTVGTKASLEIDVGTAGANNAAGDFGGGKPGGDAGGGGGYTAVYSGAEPVLIAGGGGGGGETGSDYPPTGGGGGAGGQSTAGGSAGAGQTGETVQDSPGTVALTGGGGGGGGAGYPQTTGGIAGEGGTVGAGTACPDGATFAGGVGTPGSNAGMNFDPVSGGAGDTALPDGGGGGGGFTGGGGGGGGAGDSNCDNDGGAGGGGGGSSYAASGLGSVTYASGVQSGNGEVVITYADPITASDPTYTMDENGTLTVPASEGLIQAGASGGDGDPLVAAETSDPSAGTATVASSGAFTYTPNAGFEGTDTFGYSATDSYFGDYADGTASIVVLGPPAAPAAPAATGTARAGGASVAFSAPADGGSPITGYTVTASPGGATASGTTSPITVTGLAPDQSYTFTVTATNAIGTGPASAASNPVTVPAPPTVSITSPVNNQTYDVGSTLTSAFTCTDGTGGPGIASCLDQNNQPSGTALSTSTPGTYTETVTATSQDGLTGAASVSYTVIGDPSAPGTPTTTAQVGGASVSFGTPSSDGGSTITGYTVTAFPGGKTATGTSSPIDVTGLTPGTSYTFTVTATNAAGTGPASAASNSVTVPAPPTVSITSPVNGQTYAVGSTLTSAFTCTEGAGGPGIESCLDQNGTGPNSTLSTSTPGTYTETVTVTSQDGLSGEASVTYTVASAPVTTTTATPTPTVAAPAGAGPATVKGTAKTGSTLTCALPAVAGSPTFTYQWKRDGTPIAGATGPTYKLTSADEGTTVSCVALATNAGGSITLTSAGVKVAVPKITGCPAATGGFRGTELGPLSLGDSYSQVKHTDPHASARGTTAQLFLCLTPTGIRVGFASTKELSSLPKSERAHYRRRVVFLSTANANDAIHGVRVGATVTSASHKLKLSKGFVIGLNDWYLAPDGPVTAVLKVRHNVIEEIGIADRALTAGSRSKQRTFLTSFD